MTIEITSKNAFIKKIRIFESDNYIFFIGTHNTKKTFHYLSFKKIKFTTENKQLAPSFSLKDILYENYTLPQTTLQDLISSINKKTNQTLRLTKPIQVLFGFIKFYLGYYAIIITESSKIGKIGRHVINKVEKAETYPLFSVDNTLIEDEVYNLESKYLALFKNFELTKQTYYSCSYDLTKTLQRNFIENLKKDVVPDYMSTYKRHTKQKTVNDVNGSNDKYSLKLLTNNCFLWNNYHIKEIHTILHDPSLWLVYFIYGYFEQAECNIYGLRLLITVVARRNRYYAGTRYLKRGVNNDGSVANDVETEQIVEELSTTWSGKPILSSFIHMRGSVPIYWSQKQTSLFPNPDIAVNLTDFRFDATKRHFSLLTERYGHPCIVCNLTKTKEINKKQETLLNEWYYKGVDYINKTSLDEDQQIIYHQYDLKSERFKPKFYETSIKQSIKFIEQTNLFCLVPQFKGDYVYHLSLQSGVIRSNCVDCVDRTNVYQQVIGIAALVIQLRQMGANAMFPEREDEDIYGVLTDIYKRMGHELSSQYVGSLAHKQRIKDTRNAVNKFIDKFSETFNTFQRYFNNSFNDNHKQAAFNLFLGKYKVGKGDCNGKVNMPHIWDILNDTVFHRKKEHKLMKMDVNWYSEAYNKFILRNLLCDCENVVTLIDFINKNLSVNYGSNNNTLNTSSIDNNNNNNNNTSILNSSKSQLTSSNTSLVNSFLSQPQKTFKLVQVNDYIVSFDKYVKYKLANQMKFSDEYAFEKGIPLFYYLDSKKAIRVHEFYKFSFSEITPIKNKPHAHQCSSDDNGIKLHKHNHNHKHSNWLASSSVTPQRKAFNRSLMTLSSTNIKHGFYTPTNTNSSGFITLRNNNNNCNTVNSSCQMFMGRNMTHKKTKKTLLPKRSSGLPSIIGFSSLYSKLLLPNSSSIRPCNQSYKVERIKYKLTITSFEEDLNDVNKIKAFMDFKSVNNDTTTSSAFVGLDRFITEMPKKDNEYNHGDSPYNANEYNSNNNNNNTRSVSSNNGVDGYYFKKNSYQKTNDDYYFIYVVDEKCFYKKPNTFTKNNKNNNMQSNKKNYILFNKIAFDDIYETSSLSSLSNNKLRQSHSQGSVSHSNNQSFNNNNNNNNGNSNSVFNNNNNNITTTIQNNTNNINTGVQPSSSLITSTPILPFQTQTQIRLLRTHSPKQKVNVKCIPIKILENFYDI